MKGYLVLSRHPLLEQSSIATIYPVGFQNGVSPFKFVVDEIYDYYL